MTDQARQREIRVNDTDLRLLKAAKDELKPDVPLGYVARLGAKELLNNDTDTAEVRL